MNPPRCTWEASGTRGMKVLVNGGLNVSELDGWWAEAYSPEVGRAIGDGREHGDDPSWDAAEAESLYAELEREVIPECHAGVEHVISRAWLPAARKYGPLNSDLFEQSRSPAIHRRTRSLGGNRLSPARRESRFGGSRSRRLAGRTAKHWSALRFGPTTVEHQGERYLFHV